MSIYQRKIIALLDREQRKRNDPTSLVYQLECLAGKQKELLQWWEEEKDLCTPTDLGDFINLWEAIAQSSDRVNLQLNQQFNPQNLVKHPISGQSQPFNTQISHLNINSHSITQENDAEKIFYWLWRFYPELLAKQQNQALLAPAHEILPDCPQHSFRATVSALVGATLNWKTQSKEEPCLLLFTFSPVQEFIKASRKFLDFWSGSYLLHYLSAKLCWLIAEEYGPDAVITPSLWAQEIIDAFILKKYPDFSTYFEQISPDELTPVKRFENQKSTSLSTAGFPNVITALVPGKAAATALGKKLADNLTKEWREIGDKVKADIRSKVIDFLNNENKRENFWREFRKSIARESEIDSLRRDLEKWETESNWEWNRLWDSQLNHTWESYWTVVPLGVKKLTINKDDAEYESWKKAQFDIAQPRWDQPTPTDAEESIYSKFNVGTWWGGLQGRLGKSIQAVKNTRTWNIPVSPGERSSLSGQFSAAHPSLNYQGKFTEGRGLSAGSMRLFWELMAKVYPGLFNGSEKLNCLELTKRMAWQYGGVAECLGIKVSSHLDIDYEKLIRFPNLSSIASARFVYKDLEKQSNIVPSYWQKLESLIQNNKDLSRIAKAKFVIRSSERSFQIPKTDSLNGKNGKNYNGVMFSSKWLAEDMELTKDETSTLRNLVDQAHKESGFGDGSPGDWWVIVLADGDGMGQYVSGTKLKQYSRYLVDRKYEHYLDQAENLQATLTEFNQVFTKLLKTKKRMGPATHVALNRALLDFSNRLVPYITEKRFCGKVVYSGGDDVMAVLPLEDLPEYLRSLRAAWCGNEDPFGEFENYPTSSQPKGCGYWYPKSELKELPSRPHFTMGKDATMSMGIVIAYKSVPLPTVLENLWEAEKERAKKIPGKDGLCFRVIYGGGNTLEALMKGTLLNEWIQLLSPPEENLSPLLYRLAEELPRRASVTEKDKLFSLAAKVIMESREESKKLANFSQILKWLDDWEKWAYTMTENVPANENKPRGTTPEDLGKLLRFSAFWVDKMVQRKKWVEGK
ncbi:type III-B CRISPR-associated protein Cas10/Cmr2 [[Phormidium ambiguum] IAM M-71]|uniref:Type III-B CRISPR-associated protein Cas10/Cmr2 n=1 Tax=[Phormidium ambiguum] IAM M-71 TaxID=454136 RepID=A0A1U7IB39_9CYAN|nr:type III-B CRISPR-associated protein Cas10/Cmr2 [Phormidium ambiguum]OKH33828.1 type III-B CRISPR-associated protein Cas10/Cmr2 [Phormidium ambiguum IAM M-71]